jgi:hypothetical protein
MTHRKNIGSYHIYFLMLVDGNGTEVMTKLKYTGDEDKCVSSSLVAHPLEQLPNVVTNLNLIILNLLTT